MLIKIKLVLSFLLLTKIAIACSCNQPNIFLEFYSSKYVFEGEIISKTYPKDSLTYTFTFRVNKHFKDGDNPDSLSFTWQSEGRYQGVITSCDYDVQVGEKYLVFAKLKGGKLGFGIYCSNSKANYANKEMIGTLKKANSFNPLKYHLNYDPNIFNDAKPLTNIDSLIKPYQRKLYTGDGVRIMLDIDTLGKVTARNIWKIDNVDINKTDSIPFIYDIINKKYREPINELEIDALKIAKKIKKWEVMRFKINNQAVKSRQYLSFFLDKNHKLKCKQSSFMFN